MNNRKYILGTAVIALIASFVFLVGYAVANPSQFLRSFATDNCGVSIATTTVSLMTPGAATTTSSFDTQCDGGLSADSAILLYNFNASSTLSQLRIDIEYSDNNSDWYSKSLDDLASTTPVTSLGVKQSFLHTFASSTHAGGGNAPNPDNVATRAITIKTPTRYVRAIFSIPPGAGNGSVWSEFVAKKENR